MISNGDGFESGLKSENRTCFCPYGEDATPMRNSSFRIKNHIFVYVVAFLQELSHNHILKLYCIVPNRIIKVDQLEFGGQPPATSQWWYTLLAGATPFEVNLDGIDF